MKRLSEAETPIPMTVKVLPSRRAKLDEVQKVLGVQSRSEAARLALDIGIDKVLGKGTE